ncbi:MAG: rod shape-determining protein MreC [Candidatus Colwellbacteria bacterium]|nr:rod shape-determining protein MreC [Candidatus Colwellbacteria bacterium]
MRKKRYPLIIIIAILAFVVIAANLFFDLKLSLNKSAASVVGAFDQSEDLQKQISLLQKENTDLKAQLFRESVTPEDFAVVYSSYPFNNKSEIVISWGENKGVLVGDAAVYGSSVLIGKVKQVTPENSVVTTIFDPSFETAVRIGTGKFDALMHGGNELALEFIPGDAKVEVGDRVFAAGSDLPYGLEVGQIKEVYTEGGSVFQSATLQPSFEIKTLRDVSIFD